MKHDKSQRTDIVFKWSSFLFMNSFYSWQFLSLFCMFLLTHLLKSGLLSQLFACTCLQLKGWSCLDVIHIISVMPPPFFFPTVNSAVGNSCKLTALLPMSQIRSVFYCEAEPQRMMICEISYFSPVNLCFVFFVFFLTFYFIF